MIDLIVFVGSWVALATVVWILILVIATLIARAIPEDGKPNPDIIKIRKFIKKQYWITIAVAVILAFLNSNRFLPTSSEVDQRHASGFS